MKTINVPHPRKVSIQRWDKSNTLENVINVQIEYTVLLEIGEREREMWVDQRNTIKFNHTNHDCGIHTKELKTRKKNIMHIDASGEA